jgi:tetratricopeptide (TPR) repeat protein
LAAEPDNLAIKIRMALIDIEKKEYQKAIKKLKEILAVAPDSDKVRFYLAAVLEEIDLKEEAVEHFVKIPHYSQFYGEAIVHAAYLYRSNSQSDKAEKLIDEALKNRPDFSQFYALKASLLDEKRKYAQAEDILKKGAGLFPDNEQILFFLGSVQDKIGKKQDTITIMKRVLALNDSHAQALNYLAYTYAELGQELTEAENLAKRALNLKPNDAYIIDTLGWVYFKQGKHKEAIEYLEKAHNLNPNEAIIAEHLGDVYFKVQLYTKAQEMYERAAKVERDEINQRKIESKIMQIKKAIGDNYNRVPASSY